MILQIRAARPEDADAIAAIEAVAASHPWARASVAGTLALPSTVALVAEHGGIVVGHLLASAVVDEGEVLTVAVRSERRRTGIGAALLRACRDRWRAIGVHQAWLEVRADNTGAQALYNAEGWLPAGIRPGYYTDGCDAVLMRWDLA